jgi:hypothetical protein
MIAACIVPWNYAAYLQVLVPWLPSGECGRKGVTKDYK